MVLGVVCLDDGIASITASIQYRLGIASGRRWAFPDALMGGPLPVYCCASQAWNGWAMRLLPAVSVLALVVGCYYAGYAGAELATIHSSIQQAFALGADYAMARRMVPFSAAQLCCWIVPCS